MGNGADKILAVCEKYGIEICDFFASDGFVRGHAFHGKTVLSYSEIKEKYKDFIVLVSFATALPDVLERIYEIAGEAELYVPDVPVFGETLFTREFVDENMDKIRECASLFADEESVRVYESVINAKLSSSGKRDRPRYRLPRDLTPATVRHLRRSRRLQRRHRARTSRLRAES